MMRCNFLLMNKLASIITFLCILINSCESSAALFPKPVDGKYEIMEVLDLAGQEWVLAENCTLLFNGGAIKNGTLVGSNTRLDGNLYHVFDSVKIAGTWLMPKIHSNLFVCYEEVNSLKNLFAFLNEDVENELYIDEGTYKVSIEGGNEILKVPSLSNVILNGRIELAPNSLPEYTILLINGDNIRLTGRGSIMGDKHTHLGTTGEWGMGVRLRKSENIEVSNIEVSHCWGDCIYVGRESKNVRILNCHLWEGRRQGISVTSCQGIEIAYCKIHDVRGTAPQYGIDIEPNANDYVSGVVVSHNEIYNCFGGIQNYGKAAGATIDRVEITSNYVHDCDAKYPVLLIGGNSALVKANRVQSKSEYAIHATEVDSVSVSNNRIHAKSCNPIAISKHKQKQVSNNIVNR